MNQYDIYQIAQEPHKFPWFIKWYKGQPVVTIHDFNELVGLDILKLKQFFKKEYFTAGLDYNGLGQGPLREEFERINNVRYEEHTFMYLYLSGVAKALKILRDENKLS